MGSFENPIFRGGGGGGVLQKDNIQGGEEEMVFLRGVDTLMHNIYFQYPLQRTLKHNI